MNHHACAVCGVRHPLLRAAHERSRRAFDLPAAPPRSGTGVACPLCGAACVIGDEQRGFCGLRTVREGRLRHIGGTAARGVLHWYRDPLPTNCVADWVCAGSAQRGKHNLAVFYASCTLDCLFCQNWTFRQTDLALKPGTTARELAGAADAETFCVCFFGGDPASQMLHALASARLLAQRGVVVCWETAGTARAELMDAAVELALASGGCVKFDLKAFSEPLHIALTGVSNRQTLRTFARAARRFGERPRPPPLLASTLLVPGYVDEDEVGRIAAFVAEQDPRIPYALLAFAPSYLMSDLPRTSVRHAEAARRAARAAGLQEVRIGNRHLLGAAY
jgi:pyruvate formate lyase activating enzyme